MAVETPWIAVVTGPMAATRAIAVTIAICVLWSNPLNHSSNPEIPSVTLVIMGNAISLRLAI